MSEDADELRTKATRLRSLASHVDSIMDKPKAYATDTMTQWSGPNATDVRGKLGTWKTTCGNVAQSLREEADRCETRADDMEPS